jgi:hypothetical protein
MLPHKFPRRNRKLAHCKTELGLVRGRPRTSRRSLAPTVSKQSHGQASTVDVKEMPLQIRARAQASAAADFDPLGWFK